MRTSAGYNNYWFYPTMVFPRFLSPLSLFIIYALSSILSTTHFFPGTHHPIKELILLREPVIILTCFTSSNGSQSHLMASRSRTRDFKRYHLDRSKRPQSRYFIGGRLRYPSSQNFSVVSTSEIQAALSRVLDIVLQKMSSASHASLSIQVDRTVFSD